MHKRCKKYKRVVEEVFLELEELVRKIDWRFKQEILKKVFILIPNLNSSLDIP